MTIACGGQCGRPDCKRTFANNEGLYGHIGGVKARSKGAVVKSSPGAPPPSGGGVTSTTKPFYEGLQNLPWGQEEPKKGGPSTPSGSSTTSAVPAGPLFDSSPWWLNLAKLLDDTVLADKKTKINMTEAQAKRLDASLQAAGWTVTANPHPVSMPYWLPFGITIVGAFALPLMAAFIPDLIRKAKDRATAAKEAAARVHRVEVPTKPAGIQAQASAPIAPGDEEAPEPVRIEAQPPPFAVRPMPWHEPGSG